MLRDVAVLVLPGVAPFELGIVCELFGLDRSDDGLPVPAFALVTEHPGAVPTNQGFTVGVEHGLGRMDSADLIVTAPVPRKADGTTTSPAVRQALRDAHARMSPRTLARRFADVVGASPASWVARQR